MAKNTDFTQLKDLAALFTMFTNDREAFFEWESQNPDQYFQAILVFVYQDDLNEAKSKYEEYLRAPDKNAYRLKYYLTLQIAFDQEIKRRGIGDNPINVIED